MASLHSPASIMDLATCAGTCSAFKWGAIRSQAERGRTWVLRDGTGEAIACGGIMSDGGAWFVAGHLAPHHVTAILRNIVRALDATNTPRVVTTMVVTPAGERIAAMAGFVRTIGNVWTRESKPFGKRIDEL